MNKLGDISRGLCKILQLLLLSWILTFLFSQLQISFLGRNLWASQRLLVICRVKWRAGGGTACVLSQHVTARVPPPQADRMSIDQVPDKDVGHL